jgi:hypothetical protein
VETIGSVPTTSNPKRSVEAQLESKLRHHFRDGYTRIATDDAQSGVSCIRRGGGNEYACVLTRYTWGESAYGPDAPAAAHPDRRAESEQGFNAIVDPSSGDIQFEDVDRTA